MRHGNSGRKLSRTASHRDAMYANLVTALFTYGRIESTEAKAKELRAYADAAIRWGVEAAPIAAKGEKATAGLYRISNDERVDTDDPARHQVVYTLVNEGGVWKVSRILDEGMGCVVSS